MAIYEADMDGISLKFSPLLNFRIAVTARNRVLDRALLNIHDLSDMSFPIASDIWRTTHLINDISWSNYNPNHVVVAGEDKVAHLIDVSLQSNPTKPFHGHNRSILAVEWKPEGRGFLTGSQDGTAKYWEIEQDDFVGNFPHLASVHSVSWNPTNSSEFATASSDGSLRTFDQRARDTSPTRFIHADGFRIPVLSCDWNRLNAHCLASASNGCIKIWDVRQYRTPIKILDQGHKDTIQKLKFSPHRGYEIGSCSSDSTVVLWDYGPAIDTPVLTPYSHHAVPVTGFDMSPRIEGLMASTGRDGLVCMWLHAQPRSCRLI